MVSLIMTSNALNKNLTTSLKLSSSVLSLLVISTKLMYVRKHIFIQSIQLKIQKKRKLFYNYLLSLT